ncbi:MAG: DNA-3-methyladenine glycosylase family protein [Gammaproteobacteria bacterium]|jgi:DNA-3-methyladenine glycosylase II
MPEVTRAPDRRVLLPHFRRVDPVMAALVTAAGPYRLRAEAGASPFRHLAQAIASQQISGRAADAILARFVALYAGRDGGGDSRGSAAHGVAFPTPEQVRDTAPEALRSVGFSAAKAAALRDLAAHTISGVVPEAATLETLEDEAIVARLTQVRGIGRWTVQMMLIFQLGRPDVLPVDDYGVRNGFRLAYGLADLPTPRALAEHGACWAPYRSAAAWYLWRAVDLARAGAPMPVRGPRRPSGQAVSPRARAASSSAPRPRPGARTPTRRRPAPRPRAPKSKR